MSAVSHTPGPWSLKPVNKPQTTAFDTYAEGSDCSSLSGTIVAGNEVVARVPIEGTAGFSKLIHYRNAKLIAEAPTLLDELRVARAALADFAGLTEPHAHALARRFAETIASATGGAA